MEFEKISSPSLRELFVDQLENMILSGKLKIGEKLPPERQLAQMMQVSRAVVNSGIAELEKKGFLIVNPKRNFCCRLSQERYGRNLSCHYEI